MNHKIITLVLMMFFISCQKALSINGESLTALLQFSKNLVLESPVSSINSSFEFVKKTNYEFTGFSKIKMHEGRQNDIDDAIVILQSSTNPNFGMLIRFPLATGKIKSKRQKTFSGTLTTPRSISLIFASGSYDNFNNSKQTSSIRPLITKLKVKEKDDQVKFIGQVKQSKTFRNKGRFQLTMPSAFFDELVTQASSCNSLCDYEE